MNKILGGKISILTSFFYSVAILFFLITSCSKDDATITWVEQPGSIEYKYELIEKTTEISSEGGNVLAFAKKVKHWKEWQEENHAMVKDTFEVVSEKYELTCVPSNVEANSKMQEKKFEIQAKDGDVVVEVFELIQEAAPCPVKFEWVDIEAGSFMMGGEWEEPIHKVTLTKDFKMSKYLVTFEQYDLFCENTGREKPNDKKNWGRGKQPVMNVTWEDAVDFCSWCGVELPTEAEWEYACRAGTSTEYYWGDKMDNDYCWWNGNSNKRAHPVGEKKPNAWGLYDMSGNLWELCYDYYGSYSEGEFVDPKGPEKGVGRVIRGGCWSEIKGNCTSTYRFAQRENQKDLTVGFRVVLRSK